MEKLKTLKKLTILSIILFSILLINSDKVLAYGEEVSPMLDLSTWNITYDAAIPDNIKEIALNLVDTQCQDYDHYIISTKVGFSPGGTYGNEKYFIGCFNGDMTKLTAEFTLNTSNYPKNLSINFDTQTGTYTPTYDFKTITLTSDGTINQNTTRNSYFYMSISDMGSGIGIPQIITDLEGIYFVNKITSSSSFTHYNSVKYNNIIYNKGDKMFNLADNSFVSPTSFEYEISEGTDKGKKLSLFFNGYKETDYAIINNYQTGEEITISDLKNNSTKIFDNISQDNTFIVVIYNENDEIILTRNIDIQEQLRLSGERYILVGGLNIQELNSYFLAFYNTEKEDKCFYKFKNEEEQEIDCNDETIVIKSPNKNTYVENYIKNKKDEIVVRKNVNLNYLKNLPQFKFESYFDDKENKQILEIIVENLQESDIISYSYDNEYWYTLETKRINYLDFYNSTDVYFKVERNSEIISESYFDVVYNSYVNSSNNNNLENTNFSFKNLLDSFKNYSKNNKTLNLGTDVYNQLKNSKLSLYLTIIITGSFIVLFVKAIKR